MRCRASMLRGRGILLLVLSILAASMPSSAESAEATATPQQETEEVSGGIGDVAVLSQAFDSINNFKLITDGMYETVQTEVQCQKKCVAHEACRSYSFSVKGDEDGDGPVCVWTKRYVGFDPRWSFHTRTMALNEFGKMELIGNFKSFAGMRYVSDKPHTQLDGKTEEECREACEMSDIIPCKAFSYNSVARRCLLTAGGLQYYPGFTYYERNQKVPGREGEYQHYELEESSEQKKRRLKVEEKEKAVALEEKKVRLERLQKDKDHQYAEQVLENKRALVAKEAADKAEHRAVLQAKADARQSQMKQAFAAAKDQGVYMEATQKGESSVELSKVKLANEKSAKRKYSMRATAKKAAEQQAEQKKQTAKRAAMHAASKLKIELAESTDENLRLHRLSIVLKIQDAAAKLAQRERWVKHGLLTPGAKRLLVEESKLRQQLGSLQRHIKKVSRQYSKAVATLDGKNYQNKVNDELAKMKETLDMQLETHSRSEEKRAQQTVKLTYEQKIKPLQDRLHGERTAAEAVIDAKEAAELEAEEKEAAASKEREKFESPR